VIFLPKRWREQPQGPVTVDWNHPIAQGLVVAFVPGGNASNRYGRDFISPYAYSQNGKVNALVNQGPTYDALFTSKETISTGPITFGMCGRAPDGAANSYMLSRIAGAFEFRIDKAASSVDLTSSIFEPNGEFTCDIAVSVPLVEVTKRTRFVCSTFSVAASNSFLGSRNLGASSQPFFADNQIQGFNLVSFLSRFDGKGFASAFFLWTRALSAAEMGALDENPWQLFARQPTAFSTYSPIVTPLNAVGLSGGTPVLGSPALGGNNALTAQQVWQYELEPGQQAQEVLLDAYERARALYEKFIGPAPP
jgi:hypothetical protein